MKPHPKEVKGKIFFHRKTKGDYFCMRLLCPEVARSARPGQFFMLRVNELRDPFLRRPFSFSRIFPPREKKNRPEHEGAVEIYYQVIGRGTLLMTHLPEGQRVDLLGPLGNGFRRVEGASCVILVGGGIGMAPLLSWAEELKGRRQKGRANREPDEGPNVRVLIGAGTRDRILGLPELRRMGLEPQVATEDGTLGIRGMATDLLEQELLTQERTSAAIYACGPPPMLAKAAQIADQFDLPCQVLVESRMACGVGACLGCTVKMKERKPPDPDGGFAEAPFPAPGGECGEESGQGREEIGLIAEAPAFRYARACKEGPVFDGRDILWE
jgi:dihydroorotate dehydrogenase electron transfer subunit